MNLLLDERESRKMSCSLEPEFSSVPRARHLTRAHLAEWGVPEEDGAVAELLVSELVTNALRHSRGDISLTLSREDGLLRCEVEDGDPDCSLPHVHQAHEDEERGRGLHLLDLLSRCWGSARTESGKAVWFELAVSVP